MVKKIILPLLILSLLSTSAWAVEFVRLGALQDVTGATSDVGKDEALGVREAVAYVNDTGGINGKRIKLFQYDYGYRVPEAITTYNDLIERLGSSRAASWGLVRCYRRGRRANGIWQWP